jgi:hypothetical protein
MIDNHSFDDAKKYFGDMSKFNVKDFLEFIRSIEKPIDKCAYFTVFTEQVHKFDFMQDLVLFSATFESGLRPHDVIEENKHHLKDLLIEIRNEDLRTMRLCFGCLMPIRYYFKEEFEDFVLFFNAYVDTLDDKTDDEKKQMKYKLVY